MILSLRNDNLIFEQLCLDLRPRGRKPAAQGSYIATLTVLFCLGAMVTADLTLAQDALTQNPAQFKIEPISDDEFKLALDDETSEKVDTWIEQLSSPDYAERQAARISLASIGAPSFAKLRTAYRTADELEVKLLIETMVQTAYVRWHARANTTGFLGITSEEVPVTHESDDRVTQGSIGLIVRSVMPGTPAERGGLLVGDVITSLENSVFSAQDSEPFKKFASKIQRLGPKRRVRLTVLRGAEQLEISPILGAPNKVQAKSVVNLGERVQAATNRFPIWWTTHFRQHGKPQESM